MWEELGVYLLECVLIHNPTGTLLEGGERIQVTYAQKEVDLAFKIGFNVNLWRWDIEEMYFVKIIGWVIV